MWFLHCIPDGNTNGDNMKKLAQRIFTLLNLSFLFLSGNAIADDQKPKEIVPATINQKPTVSLKISLDNKGLIKKIQSARGVDCGANQCDAKIKNK